MRGYRYHSQSVWSQLPIELLMWSKLDWNTVNVVPCFWVSAWGLKLISLVLNFSVIITTTKESLLSVCNVLACCRTDFHRSFIRCWVTETTYQRQVSWPTKTNILVRGNHAAVALSVNYKRQARELQLMYGLELPNLSNTSNTKYECT